MTSSQIAKQNLDQAVFELEAIPQPIRSLWANVTALRDHVDREMGKFLASIKALHGNALHIPNSLALPFGEARCRTELATIRTHSDFLTASAEFLEADQLVRPIVEKIHALEADLAAAVDAEARIEQDRLDRLEAAKVEAIKSLEQQFAKEAPPAPQEPKPLVRGRNIAKRDTEAEAVESEEPSFA